ncbi:MAG: hypothetical protein FWH40_03650 [Coriobacteriia bacterium]|nr:hypothetical protein [Coriobacteriia bacterium]
MEDTIHLKRSKRKDGREYISIIRTYREGKRTLTNTHLSLGYLDPASPDYDEKIAEYLALAEEMEADHLKENVPLTLEFSKRKKVDKKTANRKNVGYAALLDKFFAARARTVVLTAT